MDKVMYYLSLVDRITASFVVLCMFGFGLSRPAEASVTLYDQRNNKTNSVFANLSVTSLESCAIHLEWDLNVSAPVIGFDVFVQPLQTSGFHQHRLGSDVSGQDQRKRSTYEIDGLEPETEYELFVYAISQDGVIGASQRIVFRTLAANGEVKVSQLKANPIELIIVISILIAWAVTFGMFVHKWGTIRIIQPRDYRSKHDPKNLDTIKIVARPTDSVIYRNYSKKFTSTMAAREKKIERMNTMPNIKIAQDGTGNSSSEGRGSPKTSPDLSRFRDTFIHGDGNSAKATTSLTSKQKAPTSNFGTFQLGNKSAPEQGLMGMPISYIEQLRTTANMMLDLDRKVKKSGRKAPESSLLTLASSGSFPGRQEPERDNSHLECESMRMVPLLKVVEEDEEGASNRGTTKTHAETTHQD